MSNHCTIICMLVLVALTVSMPTNNNDSNEETSSEKKRYARTIDGAIHHVKSAGITYRQRIKDNKCFVEHDNQLIAEDTVIKIRKRTFRVENCLLERVYHACGPNLLLMLSVVCRALDQQTSSNSYATLKRETNLSPKYDFDSTVKRTKRVITESCCENLCNISELTRYCHQ